MSIVFKSKLNGNIDFILAISGLILGLVIISLYFVSPTIHLISMGLALCLGCAAYIALNKIPITENKYKASRNEKRILDILYLLLFSISLIIWNTSIDRPLSYFLIFSLCAGVLALSIYVSDNRLDYYIQYGKTLLFSFNIKYSIYMLAGFMPTVDPYIHAKMNDLLSQSGTIEVLMEKEMYFPIMHIQTAVMEIISAVPIKNATNFAVIIPFILASTFVYLVARDLFGEQIGLFSMLLVNVSDFHINWGSAPQTTSYGIIIYYFLMYVLFKVFYLRSKLKWISISIFLIFVIIITHAVSSFIFVVTMFCLFLGSILYNYLYKSRRKASYGGLFLISIIVLIQYWFIALYRKGGQPFFDQIVSSLYYYVTGIAGFLDRPEATVEVATTLSPFIERFANTLGLTLYLFFAIIGSLIALSFKHRDKIKFTYVFIMLILFGITFAFPVFGIRNILPSRWFAFEYFFVSMFAAFSIIQVSKLLKRGASKKFFITTVFFILAFFMSTSTIANLDSPLWLQESTISTTYTHAEVKGAETLSQYSYHLFSDSRYGGSVLNVYLGMNTNSLQDSQQVFERNDEIFMWRNYMLERPIRIISRVEGYDRTIVINTILGIDTLEKLDKMHRVYDNREIIGYYIR